MMHSDNEGIRMTILDTLKNGSMMQFIKFALVGASNAVVAYVLYVVFLLLFKNYSLFENYDYIVAQYLSFFMSVLWSFFWNNRYVFERTEKWYTSLIKMLVVYSVTGIFLSTALLYLMVEVMRIHELIAPIINIMIGLPINFLLNKKWAFK